MIRTGGASRRWLFLKEIGITLWRNIGSLLLDDALRKCRKKPSMAFFGKEIEKCDFRFPSFLIAVSDLKWRSREPQNKSAFPQEGLLSGGVAVVDLLKEWLVYWLPG